MEDPFGVFSTYVEVIPGMDSRGKLYAGILHVCGGDHRCRRSSLQFKVFSTYVEVILTDLVGAVLD